MKKDKCKAFVFGLGMLGLIVGGIVGRTVFTNAVNMEISIGELNVEVPENALAPDVNSSLNIRYQPSVNSAVIGKLYTGDLVKSVGSDGNWTQVEVDGQIGYVSSQYVLAGNELKKYIKNNLDKFNVEAVQTDKSFQAVYKKKKDAQEDDSTIEMIGTMKKSTVAYATKSTSATTKKGYKKVKKSMVAVDGLRMRSKPSLDGEIYTVLGRGTILDIVSKKQSGWYKIKYDGRTGYVSSAYCADVTVKQKKSNIVTKLSKGQKYIVDEVSQNWVALQLDTGIAYVLRNTCKVVTKTTQEENNVVGWLENNETCQVCQVVDDMAYISLADGNQGYIPADTLQASIAYSDISFDQSVIEKEQKKLLVAQQNSASVGESSTGKVDSGAGVTATAAPTAQAVSTAAPVQINLENVSETRRNLVNYALTFVGNKYVWGGNSLTEGVDCSGFTQQIFLQYGVKLNRCSYQQPENGTEISFDQLRPGDLVFYFDQTTQRIGHVAIYIGDGYIVHAKSSKAGITTNEWNYRTPYKAVNVLGD